MNKYHILTTVATAFFSFMSSAAQELNMPIIQTKYTADPARSEERRVGKRV